MPRPKNPDTVPTPETPEQAIEMGLLDVTDIPEDRAPNDTLAQALEVAMVTLEEKREVNERMQNQRQLTTLLVGSGMGSREQVAEVRFYLPRKTRKTSNGEVEVSEIEAGEEE